MAREREARRGLSLSTARWKAIRKQVLLRDRYTCQRCGRLCGYPGEAHVDHIDGDTFDNRLEALQTLCIGCHSRKTNLENGGFGNKKREGPVFDGCDLHGNPHGRKDW